MSGTTEKDSNAISRNVVFAIVVVTLIIGFSVGVYRQQIFAAVAPVLGIPYSAEQIDTTSLQQTYQQLQANFDGELDDAELIEGANRGLVRAAGDPHTTFMSSAEREEFEAGLSGNIGGGIGAEIGLRDDQPAIIRTLSDTPAEREGLLAGDKVLAVNQEDATSWDVDQTVARIRGEVDTTVRVDVLRGDERLEFNITREEIVAPSVEHEIKDNMGILTISRFDSNTASSAREAARSFERQNVDGVVVDLRGNAGGYLTAAQQVAGIWLNNEIVVTERRAGEVVEELRSGRNPILEGVPTVVLVNEFSASASEIVAGALQDYEVATIVGETTYGKGTVQRLVNLSGGAQLRVTVARWFTPQDRDIEQEGVEPDEQAERTLEDIENNRDPQLDAALNILAS